MTLQLASKIKIDKTAENNIIYIGTAPCGASEDDDVWQIKRLTLNVAGNIETITYANGIHSLNCNWTDRLTYDYE